MHCLVNFRDVRIEDRFFVVKAKTRAVIETSQSKGIWATRSHASCIEGDQPHERLAAVRDGGRCRVILLFAESSEHAWVGHAVLETDPWYDSHEVFPYICGISWRTCLPHAQGVSFGSIPAGDVHKVHNCDEISNVAGHAICDAIDSKMESIRQLAEDARRELHNSAFVYALPGETESDVHQRLLSEVERRLGPIVVACLCGSRRYNLHFPDSDRDLLVVYAARDPEEAPAVIKNPVGLHPDYTVLEAGRFMHMLREGDPRMVESLFLDEGAQPTEDQGTAAFPPRTDDQCCILKYGSPWPSIIQMREHFVCQTLVSKYLRDATGRTGLAAVRRGAKKDRHPKILYIAFRTLANALQACRGEVLQVRRRSDSEEHAFIMAVRREEGGSHMELLARAEALVEDVRKALHASALAAAPAPDVVIPLLAEVRDWCTKANSSY